jgi:leucyl aminopeptidase
MHPLLVTDASTEAVPVHAVDEAALASVVATLPVSSARFVRAIDFKGKPGTVAVVPGADGAVSTVLLGIEPAGQPADPFLVGKLPGLLPKGTYRFASGFADPATATLAWLLGSYRFGRFKAAPAHEARLVVAMGVDAGEISAIAEAVTLGRDLINTPANVLGPVALASAALELAERHGASSSVIVGEDLLDRGFPLIHAVGRAAAEAPRLVDITWGDPAARKVTLVGKGVCFDTGGLDIKPESAMLIMKKDMGGAAAAIAAASMIMAANLPVRLRVLLPIVENAISAPAFRPGDIFRSRKGLTVEIGNTDAEGRLILADALALADEESPELLVDFATLTGAARVALGPELPPFFTRDDALAGDIQATGVVVNDPVWRLPLWSPYDKGLESKVADLNNVSPGGFAGSITAALFLNRFVQATTGYVHFDIYGWCPSARPGRPEGGEVQAARLIYRLVKDRFGSA